MNTPNPLVPKGVLPDQGKSHVRITVFAILAVHVVLLGVLLIAGCDKKTESEPPPPVADIPTPPPPSEPDWPEPASPPPVPEDMGVETVEVPAPPAPPPDAPFAPPTPPSEGVEPPLPPPADTPAPPPAPAYTEHTIVKGDSFYSLGQKYQVSYKAIAAANPDVHPNRLKIGAKVKIPPAGTGSASASAGGSASGGSADDGRQTYKVKSGDNLWKIARTHDVTVKQLRAANDLVTDRITVGQQLVIPVKRSTSADATEPPPVPPPPGQPPL